MGNRLSVSDHTAFRLHQAINRNDVSTVHRLVQKYPDLANIVYFHGGTPLAVACGRGNISIVNLLLPVGMETLNLGNRTPLMQAASNGHFEIVARLIAIGARVEVRCNYGQTVFHHLARHRSPEQISMLRFLTSIAPDELHRSTTDGITPLQILVRYNNLRGVKFVLRNGLKSLDISDSQGNTPLMIAATKGYTKIIRYLKGVGARVDLSGLSFGAITRVSASLSPEEILKIRYRIHFMQSLVVRLLS